MDDERRKERDRLIRTLDAGFLVRWDQHDPDSLEAEVGPMTRGRVDDRELQEAWFD